MKQGSNEWLAMRKKYIGASDASVLMGVNKKYSGQPKKTPKMLWEEKLGLVDAKFDSDAMRYGRQMEPVARAEYEKMMGESFEPDIVFHHYVPYMMASLDGINASKDMMVEIKNCNAEDHATAKAGEVPIHYYPQVQHQLACAKLDRMHYFSFHKNEGIIVEVKRNSEYLDDLYEKEEKFWECVQQLVEPDLTEDDYGQMDEVWERAANLLWETESRIKQDQKVAKALKEELKASAEGRNAKAGDYRLCVTRKRGGVDYSKIPELESVDLEIYRKSPIESWSLKKNA